jgi:hypothetical protein
MDGGRFAEVPSPADNDRIDYASDGGEVFPTIASANS